MLFKLEGIECQLTDSGLENSVLAIVPPGEEENFIDTIKKNALLDRIITETEKRDTKAETINEIREELIQIANNLDIAGDLSEDMLLQLSEIRFLAEKIMAVINEPMDKNEEIEKLEPVSIAKTEYIPEYAPGEFLIDVKNNLGRDLVEAFLKNAPFGNTFSWIENKRLKLVIDPNNEKSFMDYMDENFSQYLEGWHRRDFKRERVEEFFETMGAKFDLANDYLEQIDIDEAGLYKYLGDIENLIARFREQIRNNMK